MTRPRQIHPLRNGTVVPARERSSHKRIRDPLPSCAALPLLGLLLALLPTLSCSNREPSAQAGSTQLRVPLYRWVSSLDPAESGEIETHNVVRQLYEGLVDYDPESLRVVPRVAASFTAGQGGREWRFVLRPDVFFVDDPCFPSGRRRAVVSTDVKYSMERALQRRGGRGAHQDLPPIAGLEDFLAGRAGQISGIEAESPHELTIRLLQPDLALLHFLAGPACLIVPREAVETYGADLARHPVGTGPFRLASAESNSGILLVRNPDYWRRDESGERLPYVDALLFIWEPELDPRRLFVEGRLDAYQNYGQPIGQDLSFPSAMGDSGAASVAGTHCEVCYLNTIFLRINFSSAHPLAHNRALRAALAAICSGKGDNLAAYHHRSAKGLFPPGLSAYDPLLVGQQRDPEAARSLLRHAGYPAAARLPPIRIGWPWAGDALLDDIIRSLHRFGLKTKVEIYPRIDYERSVEARDPDLFRDGWIADWPDAENFLQLFVSGSSENRGHYQDARFDRFYDSLRTEIDPRRRVALARAAEKCLLDDVAAVFCTHETASHVVSPRIRNYAPYCTNPLNVRFYERIRLHAAARL